MFHLLMAALCTASISILMRLSEKYISNSGGMLTFNYGMCLLLAWFHSQTKNIFPSAQGTGTALVLGMINGILFVGGFLLLQWNIRKNGVILSTTFMRLGVIVPIILSILFMAEIPKRLQIVGLVIAVIAIIVMNPRNNRKSQHRAGLIVLLIIGGLADFMSKVFEVLGDLTYKDHFLCYAFGTAFILCIGLNIKDRKRIGAAEIGYGILIGIPNYFTARFLILSLRTLSTILVYPVYSIGGIILVSIAGVFVFREKLGIRQKGSILMIFIALILLNM